jgi:hypothetical protein
VNALGVAWALRQRVKSPEEKLIVILIGAWSDESLGFVGREEWLAEGTGYSIHLVNSVLHELHDRRAILVDKPWSDGGFVITLLEPHSGEDGGIKPSKKGVTQAQRERILRRDRHTCVVCGANDVLHVDHVFPRSAGGPDVDENLQTLCVPCNLSKSDKTFESWIEERVAAGKGVFLC